MSASCSRLIRRMGSIVGAVTLLLLIAVPAAQAQTPSQDIHSAGPLSDIWTGNELSCQVGHTQDSRTEFYPGASGPGDCGTFLVVNTDSVGALFGPDFSNHAAGSAAGGFSSPETPWTPMSQTGVMGSGTAASPYQVTTVVQGLDGNLTVTVTEVDSYVVGNDFYRTDITVADSGSAFTGELFHAGDCFLRGFDTGFGFFDPSTNTPACTINPDNSPASALMEFSPITSGNFGVETSYPTIWSDIGEPDLPNTCDCTTNEDNAEGINWDVSLGIGGSTTFSMLTKIDDPAIAATGGQTFSGTAPATVSGTVAAITDSDTSTSPSDYTATVDWGDGSAPDQNATITGSNGSFTVADGHTYTTSGSYTITVTVSYVNNPGNTATAIDSASIGAPAPTVTSVSPTSGPAAGETSVTITGTSFTGATAVSFGGTAATSYTVNSDSQITATSPAGSGTVDVTVTTPGGTSATSSADRFSYTSLAPVVFTGAPSVTGSTGAGFSGSVNPLGLGTTAYFQYGLDLRYSQPGASGPTYTNSTPVKVVGSDFSAHFVSASVSGLVPNALYHVRLVAINSLGTTDGPDQTFMTKEDPPPPPPVLGKSFDLAPVSGLVLIKLTGHPLEDARLLPRAATTTGPGFVPLTEARQLPSGAQVDARLGKLKLVSATTQRHKTQTGTFNGGIFNLGQQKSGKNKGLTTLSLLEGAFRGAPSYASCTAKKASDASSPTAHAARLSSRVLQSLHGSGHGRFSTRGRYGAATAAGTGQVV